MIPAANSIGTGVHDTLIDVESSLTTATFTGEVLGAEWLWQNNWHYVPHIIYLL